MRSFVWLLASLSVLGCGGVAVVDDASSSGGSGGSAGGAGPGPGPGGTGGNTTIGTGGSSCGGLGYTDCLGAAPTCVPVFDDKCCPSCNPGPCADCTDPEFVFCGDSVACSIGPSCGFVADFSCGGPAPKCDSSFCETPGCTRRTCSVGMGGPPCLDECVPVEADSCTAKCNAIPPECPPGYTAQADDFCWTGFCIEENVCFMTFE